MTDPPPRVSEKIETDAIEELLEWYEEEAPVTLDKSARDLRDRARAQLARLKSAAQERDAALGSANEAALIAEASVLRSALLSVRPKVEKYCPSGLATIDRALKSTVPSPNAAAALLRSYRAACGEHASTMVLVHRDEIDGVLGEREEAERG